MTFLKYKCRHCGQTFSNSSQLLPEDALNFYINRNQVTLIHDCGPLQLGVADLIGTREAFNQEEANAA